MTLTADEPPNFPSYHKSCILNVLTWRTSAFSAPAFLATSIRSPVSGGNSRPVVIGLAALRFLISHWMRRGRMMLTEAPEAIRRANIDLLLVDQIEVTAGCVTAFWPPRLWYRPIREYY